MHIFAFIHRGLYQLSWVTNNLVIHHAPWISKDLDNPLVQTPSQAEQNRARTPLSTTKKNGHASSFRLRDGSLAARGFPCLVVSLALLAAAASGATVQCLSWSGGVADGGAVVDVDVADVDITDDCSDIDVSVDVAVADDGVVDDVDIAGDDVDASIDTADDGAMAAVVVTIIKKFACCPPTVRTWPRRRWPRRRCRPP